MKKSEESFSELKVWSKPRIDIGKELSDEVSVSKNGYFAIGSVFAQYFHKFAILLYSDNGLVGIKPVSERSRNAYTVNSLLGRSSRLMNATSFVTEIGIRSGRYKATWHKERGMLIFKAKVLKKPD